MGFGLGASEWGKRQRVQMCLQSFLQVPCLLCVRLPDFQPRTAPQRQFINLTCDFRFAFYFLYFVTYFKSGLGGDKRPRWHQHIHIQIHIHIHSRRNIHIEVKGLVSMSEIADVGSQLQVERMSRWN